MNKVYLIDMDGINCLKMYYEPHFYRDEIKMPYFYLREEIEKAGFEVHLAPPNGAGVADAAFLLSFGNMRPELLRNIAHVPRKRRMIVICEPPVVQAELFTKEVEENFGIVFTFFDDQVDDRTFFKIHHPQAYDKQIDNMVDFSLKKKLATMILGYKGSLHPKELYTDRKETALFLGHTPDFDLYGQGWDDWPNWRGVPQIHKLQLLKQYKFVICYENMDGMRGHISERIFDPFFAGSVPIYWGASNIDVYVPKQCFIDRREFLSNAQMLKFLKSVDRKRYQEYLDAAKAFLKSPLMEPWHPKSFARTIVKRMIAASLNGL